jgi:ADP-heptose:LPS heptosyltransferase
VARFAEVARALHEQGHALVLTGVAGERPLAQALQAALPRGACIDLLGQTDLWTMGALIKSARLLICNDTGVSHVAAALGTPSVVISCGADVSRWAPSDSERHRVLWSDQPCRPCANVECPTAHECAWDIAPASVLDAAQTLLAARA